MKKPTQLLLTLALALLAALSANAKQTTRNDLVGTYVFGFQWGGDRITLKEDGTFVQESSSCTSVTIRSGPYTYSADHLHLTVERLALRSFDDGKEVDLRQPKARKRFLDTSEPFKIEQVELRVVAWGKRVYLMDDAQVEQFMDAINLGLEPRRVATYRPYYGEILMREGDESLDVVGTPSLPSEFLSMLLSAPVTATVIYIEMVGDKTVATVNRGRVNGLWKGMTLVSDKDRDPMILLGGSVLSVEDQTAKVQAFTDVRLGDKLTTRIEDVSYYSFQPLTRNGTSRSAE
jgi:hypothetical protein